MHSNFKGDTRAIKDRQTTDQQHDDEEEINLTVIPESVDWDIADDQPSDDNFYDDSSESSADSETEGLDFMVSTLLLILW